MSFCMFHQHRICLIDLVYLIWSLYSWWKVLGLLPQPHRPCISIMVLFPLLHVDHALGFTPEAALEDLGLPLWGPGVAMVQLLGSQWFWQHQVLRGVGGSGSRKYSALEGYGNQYWPVCSSILAWRTPLPDRNLAGHSLQRHKELDTTEVTMCA